MLIAVQILGPVIGGFTAGPLGWRWSFWILAIFSGAVALAAVLAMRETHPQVLLARKTTASLRAGNRAGPPRSHTTRGRSWSPSSCWPVAVVAMASLVRPCRLLCESPILLVLSVYVAFVSGTLYLLLTTFVAVFEGQYGFRTTISGLSYLGLGAALLVAMVAFRVLGDRVRGTKPVQPESRLVLMIWFSPMVALGLFVYGWTTYYKVHWIVPMLSTSVIGFGVFFVLVSAFPPPPLPQSHPFLLPSKDGTNHCLCKLSSMLKKKRWQQGQMPAQLYLVDLFGSQSSASALGANNLLRFLANTFLPLAGPAMYQSLGLGWGNTLLGLIALSFIPAPLLFYKFGNVLRAW